MTGIRISGGGGSGAADRTGDEWARSSDVETMSRIGLGVTGTITSGSVYAAKARVKNAGTWSKIRFIMGATAPVTPTDTRAGVWDSAGAVLAETANESATVIAANGLYTLNLLVPVTLVQDQIVYLGVGQVAATAGNFKGYTSISALATLAPAISGIATGWAGGALPALTGIGTQVPWVELVP